MVAVTTGGDILCGTTFYPSYNTSGGNWLLGEDGSNRYIQWSPSWADSWNKSSGLRVWGSPSGSVMTLDGGGALSSSGIIRSTSGHIVAQGPASTNPSVAVYNTIGYASCMFVDNNGTIVFGDADGNGNAQNYRVTIDRSSNIDTGGQVSGGTLTATGTVHTGSYLTGSDSGNAATLLDASGGHQISFRWDGTWTYIRVDHGGFEAPLVTGQCRNLHYDVSGGPSGQAQYGLNASGQLCTILVSSVSDERVKQNIRPSQVDALQIINAIPIEEFEIKADVAGWFQGANEPSREERARLMREAKPEHVPIGMVAQKLRALVPEAVNVSPQVDHPDDSPLPPNVMTLNEGKLVPYLLRAIQQLTERVQFLEARA